MTVPTEFTPRVAYTGNGATTAFAFPFRFFASADLHVYVAGVLKTLGVDYTVTGAGSLTGGTVTFTTAPASGASVVLWRAIPLTQATDLREFDSLSAETQEVVYDRVTLEAQDIAGRLHLRAPMLDESSAIPGLTIDTPVANQVLRWNGSANGIISTADQSPIAASAGAYYNVRDTAWGAKGDGVTDDRGAIQAAINAAQAAGGGLVFFPPGTYLCNTGLTVTGNNITLQGCGPSSILKLGGGSSALTLVSVLGVAVGVATAITATAALAAKSVTVASPTGFATDGYLWIQNTENLSPNNAYSLVSQITGVAGSVVSFLHPLPFVIGASDTPTASWMTPTSGCAVIDLAFDGSANTGASFGLNVDTVRNCAFRNLWFRDFHKNGGLNGIRWLNCTVDRITLYKCGDPGGAAADLYILDSTACAFDGIFSDRSTGFGPEWVRSAYSAIGRVTMVGATGRGIKLMSVVYSSAGALIGCDSGGGTNVFLQGCRRLCIDTVISNGAAQGSGEGVVSSGTQNQGVFIGKVTTTGSATLDFLVGASDNGIAVGFLDVGDSTKINIQNSAQTFTAGRLLNGTGGIPGGWGAVIPTGSLPAAATKEDGRIVVEDNGAGDRNLIIYAGGQRFRIDGGAPF